MKQNLTALNVSIDAKEPNIDSAYIKQNTLIISPSPESHNKLQDSARRLRNNITAIGVLRNHAHSTSTIKEEILKNIISDLKTKGMNFSEFVSYWSVYDISFSVYSKMNDCEKLVFINEMVNRFLDERDRIYQKYGYSDVSLQTKSDSALHKASRELGLKKVSEILLDLKFVSITKSIEDFELSNLAFLHADKDGKEIANQILEKNEITFDWKEKHEGKCPDFLIKIEKKLIILEHKHMKECGGGQDKQLNEIIDLVNSDNHDKSNLFFMSFLDGILFNQLFDGIKLVDNETIEKKLPNQNNGCQNKLETQRNAIIAALRRYPNNYFVNTEGFKYIIKELMDSPS